MVLEGLTFEQYREIVNFVLKYHRFGHINKENNFPAKYSIKYIDNCFDTRTLTIWSVSFRGFGTTFRFATNSFVSRDYNTLYDWIMAFLKGEYTDLESIKFEE